ncbi:hypothetical protein ACS0TY_009600 [Phlomoides rotata]
MKINGPNHSDLSENLQDYMKSLEEERRKIQVFQRELPLCLDLVTQAIETCKQQLSGTTPEYNYQSECSEQVSSVVPVFEEFIPIKRASSDSDGEEQESKKFKIECNKDGEDQNCKKSDWLRSVQLWNQTPDPISKEESPRKIGGSEVKLNDSGAFHPFRKEKKDVAPTRGSAAPPPPSTSCTAETGGGSKKEGQSQRKTRRSWSPELHRRFLQALKELGGPHVATPKQIRELMKVDGLTNDEVKSHLQKYRLHTRRPSSSTPNNNTQTPQFVVVGGIWAPPEHAAMATATTSSAEESSGATFKKVYAPVAARPPPFQEPPPSPKQTQHMIKQSDDRGSYRKGAGQSCSPVSSSSTHSAAVSPAC